MWPAIYWQIRAYLDTPASSQPKPLFQNQRAAQQAITPADVNFTPILQGQSRSRTVKNRETPGNGVESTLAVER